MIRVCLLKRKGRGVKVDPKLGGQWKVPSLVVNGMFQARWPMGCSKLGGQWKVKEKHLFTFCHFPPNKIYLNLQFFPLTLRFYFTMVLGRYSCIYFFFLDL
jgi:hypothetical protein